MGAASSAYAPAISWVPTVKLLLGAVYGDPKRPFATSAGATAFCLRSVQSPPKAMPRGPPGKSTTVVLVPRWVKKSFDESLLVSRGATELFTAALLGWPIRNGAVVLSSAA